MCNPLIWAPLLSVWELWRWDWRWFSVNSTSVVSWMLSSILPPLHLSTFLSQGQLPMVAAHWTGLNICYQCAMPPTGDQCGSGWRSNENIWSPWTHDSTYTIPAAAVWEQQYQLYRSASNNVLFVHISTWYMLNYVTLSVSVCFGIVSAHNWYNSIFLFLSLLPPSRMSYTDWITANRGLRGKCPRGWVYSCWYATL